LLTWKVKRSEEREKETESRREKTVVVSGVHNACFVIVRSRMPRAVQEV
jgi:hypothetical protein